MSAPIDPRIHVHSCEEIIEVCDKDTTLDVINIQPTKPDSKSYKGDTKYFPFHIVINKANKVKTQVMVFNPKNDENQVITIGTGLPDPTNEKDALALSYQTNEKGVRKYEIECYVKQASVFGQAMLKLNNKLLAKIKSLNNDPNYKFEAGILGEAGVKRSLSGFLKTHYSAKAHDVALRETERPDDAKIIKLKLKPFEVYEKAINGCQVGDCKTMIFDYDTGKKTPDGKIIYQPATVDGKRLNKDNIHKFVKGGAYIRKMRVRCNAISKTQQWVSTNLEVDTIVIQSNRGNIQYDDDMDAPPSTRKIDQSALDACNEEETEIEVEVEETETTEAEETEIEETEIEETDEAEEEPESEPAKPSPTKTTTTKAFSKAEVIKPATKAEPVKAEPIKSPVAKAEPVKAPAVKTEPVKAPVAKAEPVKAPAPAPTVVAKTATKVVAKAPAAKPAVKKPGSQSAADLIDDL